MSTPPRLAGSQSICSYLGGTIVTMDQTRRVIDDGGIAIVEWAHRRDWTTRRD